MRQCASTAQDPVLAQAAQAEVQQEHARARESAGLCAELERQRDAAVRERSRLQEQLSTCVVSLSPATPRTVALS